MRKTILAISIPFILLFISLIIRNSLLGDARIVNLNIAAPNSGIIAMSLITTGGSISVPVAGSDFNLTKTKYFDNKKWIVANITSTKGSYITNGLVVLQEQNGIYKVMVGPGTSFDNSLIVSLPPDVAIYLSNNGYIYEYSYQ